MLTIYVDPSTENQVMAIYDGCKPGNPQVWLDQGFVEASIENDSPLYSQVKKLARDCCIDFNAETVTQRKNSVQPIPSTLSPEAIRLKELIVKLAEDTITDIEIREMLRLERGL